MHRLASVAGMTECPHAVKQRIKDITHEQIYKIFDDAHLRGCGTCVVHEDP